ncbi:hypothetical protein CEXT_351301, partial [Caerostris extrusa]
MEIASLAVDTMRHPNQPTSRSGSNLRSHNRGCVFCEVR